MIFLGIIFLVLFIIIVVNQYKKIPEVNKSETLAYDPHEYIELAGIRHYKVNNRLDFHVNDQVYLIREPENEYDCFAIKVVNKKGRTIGHIPKPLNLYFWERIKEGIYIKATIFSINRDEPKYPFAVLHIEESTNRSIIDLNDAEYVRIFPKS